MMIKRSFITIVILSLAFLIACSSSGDGTTVSNVTATITASSGIDTFTYHSQTAYKANFSDAGLLLSGATSSTLDGSAIAGYSWDQISGPTITAAGDATSETFTFSVPAMTGMLSPSDQYRWQAMPIAATDPVVKIRLTVTDELGNSSDTTFTIYLFDNGDQLQTQTGLPNVGVGEKTYIHGPSFKANSSTASTAVTNWAWVLTPPAGSAAAFGDTGGLNSASQITNFTPDVEGTYTLTYSSTSPVIAGTLTIYASDYVGVGTIAGATASAEAGQCGACHTDTTSEWQNTGHEWIFSKAISSYKRYAPEPYCWECHTVGYDTAATVSNGGFSGLVAVEGYSFPSDGTTWDEFTQDEPTLTQLTNVQCENCHGPGGVHTGAMSSFNAGICGKCHSQYEQWKISAHDSTGVENNAGRYQLSSWWGASCARCHSSGGFIQEAAEETVTAQSSGDFLVTCQACHDPHSVAADDPSGPTSVSGNNSTQLRLNGIIAMKDDARTPINAHKAAVCYSCHDGFYAYNEEDCDSDGDGTADAICITVDQAATQYFRMPHGNTQSFVLEGVGAITAFSDSSYDFTLTEDSFHSTDLFTLRNGSGNSELSDVNNKCVTCHMAEAVVSEEISADMVGSHTFKVANNGTELISACTPCHTTLTDFNRKARADYDGDGSISGIKDEIKGLLYALSTKILSIYSTNITGGTTMADDGTITVVALGYRNQAAQNATNIDLRRGIYNYNVIARDGSLGVHNMAFAVQLLQRSYTAISTMNGGNSFAVDHPNAILR